MEEQGGERGITHGRGRLEIIGKGCIPPIICVAQRAKASPGEAGLGQDLSVGRCWRDGGSLGCIFLP